jgi:hypothetical protein
MQVQGKPSGECMQVQGFYSIAVQRYVYCLFMHREGCCGYCLFMHREGCYGYCGAGAGYYIYAMGWEANVGGKGF